MRSAGRHPAPVQPEPLPDSPLRVGWHWVLFSKISLLGHLVLLGTTCHRKLFYPFVIVHPSLQSAKPLRVATSNPGRASGPWQNRTSSVPELCALQNDHQPSSSDPSCWQRVQLLDQHTDQRLSQADVSTPRMRRCAGVSWEAECKERGIWERNSGA